MVLRFDEFVEKVETLGFLFFTGPDSRLPCLASIAPDNRWHTGEDTDPWVWKDRAAMEHRLAYGCLLGGHKGFVSRWMYPVFYAAFRPDRPTDVALVPLGYGDGVFRALGNQGEVLINGRRYPMAGRVSMDSFGVDVGTDGRVKVGDAVTLIGADGADRITVEELAHRLHTINYEVTCDIALDRSQRVFVNHQT